MKTRLPLVLLLVAAPVLSVACGKLLGPPPRPKTDGYSALVTVRAGGAELAKFRLAVRGEAVRRSTSDAENATYFIRETAGGEVLEVRQERLGRSHAVALRGRVHLEDFPLGADFNHAAEANRRGIKDYHRESDAVFAGNACNIWRFADRPDAFNSPTTTYWTTPALDGVVVRKVRAVPRADGKEDKTFVELTYVRVGIAPELFRAPEGYRREDAPAR